MRKYLRPYRLNSARKIALSATAAILLAASAAPAPAEPARDAILASLATQAKAADPAFTGFSADRGGAFWNADHTGGNPDLPSCTSCHTKDPTAEGKTRAGKTIAPMALSKTPDRFTDESKVFKWFDRSCKNVLGRVCTPTEEGDIIAYLSGK
jgi:hypothetical protein